MIEMKISTIRNAVPKSGCLAISSAGTARRSRSGIARWRNDRPSSAGESFQVLAEGDDGQDLHHLRRLQVQGAKVKPTPAAADHLPNARMPTSSATPMP